MLCGAGFVVCLCVAPLRGEAQARPAEAGQPASQETETVANGKPTLMILTLSPGQESAVNYTRLVTQLRLVVDDYSVVPRDIGADNPFVSSEVLSEDVIQRIMAGVQADVAVWMTTGAKGADIQWYLMLRDRPGVLSRHMAVTNREELEAELALIVREQLQALTAGSPHFMDNAAPSPLPVDEAKPVAPPPKVPPRGTAVVAPRSDRAKRAAGIAFLAEGGVWGSSGPSSQLGGTIDARWFPIRSLQLGLSISAVFKTDMLREKMDFFWYTVALGLSGGYLWQMGPVSLGPEIEVFYLWSKVRLASDPDTELTSSWSNFRAALGPTLQWAITARLAVYLAGSMGLVPAAKRFEDQSDQSTIFAQPLVVWKIRAGALLFF